MSNDAHAKPGQNTKKVECRLRLTYEKLAATEANIYTFTQLKSMDLATNDVASFVTKQTTHKRVTTKPDLKVQRAAMKSKLIDALSYAKRLRQQRDTLRRRVVRKAPSKAHGRRICTGMVDHYQQVKMKEMSDAKKKIEHIKWKDLREKEIRKAPIETSEYLSHVNVFTKHQKTLKPIDPEMPFICSKDIKLNSNELKLLARGPNFMIRDDLDKESFEIELEKSVVKQKYETMFSNKDDCLDQSCTKETESPGNRTSNKVRGVIETGSETNVFKSETNKLSEICDRLWEESSGGMVYNIKDKTLDLGNMKATSYKYNKMVCMPDPESPEVETAHQFRRTEARRIFERAVNAAKPNPSKVADNGRGKSNKVVNHESNLTREEWLGLTSLKKRVKEGSIVVADTDKSKRFCLLTREQYLQSGTQHTSKDLEIEPERVKRVQNYVNDHVNWLKACTNIGINWQHDDRMSRNLRDKGEQVCQMTLLLKDHKGWEETSGKPVPSRPVVSGNNGLNCHLSEIVSMIIEPVAYEQSGCEVDSTDDLLAKIDSLNENLPIHRETNNDDISKEDTIKIVDTDIFEPDNKKIFENSEKMKLEPGDIRNFGVSGVKTNDNSGKGHKLKLKQKIETLRNKRKPDSILPDVAEKLVASSLIDELNENQPMKVESEKIPDPRPKQKDHGVAIVGADVCQLFPSLKNIETARLARYAVMHSNVDFANWDFKKALRYLYIVGGKNFLKKVGLSRVAPKWTGDRSDLLTVGGSKSNGDAGWRDSQKELYEWEKRKIIGYVVEVAVHVVTSTHIYKFCGKYYLQVDGGPIGLRSTASLASLIMKIWDICWQELMDRELIEILKYVRYVDDSRNFLRPLAEGWFWSPENARFEFNIEKEIEDLNSGITDQARTTKELVSAMSSICSFLKFEGEEGGMFANSRLPTLDTEIWLDEQTGKIQYSFFEKPTCPNRVIQKETALAESSIRSTLIQETVRRLKNCSLELPMEEKQEILSVFAQKMCNSGHSISSIQYILVHGVVKFIELVRLSQLEKTNFEYKPIHPAREHDVIRRKLHKMLQHTGWFSESEIALKSKWRQNVPRNWAGGKPDQFCVPGMKFSSVMHVPSSKNGRLVKMLSKAEPRVAKITGYQVKYVEKGGRPLSRMFSKELSQNKCFRPDCAAC